MPDDYQGPKEIPAGVGMKWVREENPPESQGSYSMFSLKGKDGDIGIAVTLIHEGIIDGFLQTPHGEIEMRENTVFNAEVTTEDYEFARSFIPAMKYLPPDFQTMFQGFYKGERGKTGVIKEAYQGADFIKGFLGEDSPEAKDALYQAAYLAMSGESIADRRKRLDEEDLTSFFEEPSDVEPPDDLPSRF